MDKTAVRELLAQNNILTELTEEVYPALQKKGLDFGFSGTCIVEGFTLKILAGFSHHFPNHKPIYFLLNPDDVDYIPHVETDGAICYTHDENLVMDIDNPAGIIKDTFSLVIKTLSEGIRKENQNDFLNEFEAYWNRLSNTVTIFTNIEIKDSVEVIKIGNDKKQFFAVSDSQERINSIKRFIHSEGSPPLSNGVYIPLEKGVNVSAPHPKTELTIEFIKELINKNISPANEKKLTAILKSKTKGEDFLIISFPQPNCNYAIFGVHIKGINHSTHPFITAGPGICIKPLSVNRLDKEYMLARGGNGISFADKKVLLIGGGAVGGYIAEELIKSSIVKVDIVDSDKLGIENCYRHTCGFAYLNKNKAEALKLKLEQYYPHSEINAYPNSIESLIAKRKIDFNKYDAIVVATGNATINMYLTNHFRQIKLKSPVLFSWLDPYGIGGHCLIMYAQAKGCYNCLYANNSLHNKGSFADAEQPKTFLKSISGCGSVYSPYSSLDAVQTALLTVRRIIFLFGEKETDNVIYSWKGNPKYFINEGFKLSKRYAQSEDELENNKSKFYDPTCTACGDK